jgi:tRNA(fMet)-specific endonuclease VapC
MKAFDTDVLTEGLLGNPAYAARIAAIPPDEQIVPIIAIEEIIRGRLNVIRQAESGKSRVAVERAYELFEQTLADVRDLRVLSMTQAAEDLVKEWRRQKVKGSTHDLRIAACCVLGSVTLVTRNRRDFERVPGLSLEVWE